MNTDPPEPAVILVTGASRGLGRGIAKHCAQAGFSVAIHYVENAEAAQGSVEECRTLAKSPRQKFVPIQGNLAESEDRPAMVKEVLSELGRLDALVNNAGIAPRERLDLTETTEKTYNEVMAVNLKGPYFLSQRVVHHWLEDRSPCRLPGGYKLVFVTSISADCASITRGEYCVSKAGLSMAAQLWAVRLAKEDIQVFEIRPGLMATDMTAGVRETYDRRIGEGLVPQRRWGKPEDVGLAVGAVLQGCFPFSTGSVIHVDGGFHLRRL